MSENIKKYSILIASIFIMLCLGGIYAFSVYVPPLKSQYLLSTSETQLIFGFTIASFAICLVIAGRILKNIGPRISAIISAALFSSGYLLAAFSRGNLIILVIGMGILSGGGIGFGYICSLTTPIKWFKKHKGLITGLSVAGFGGGAILLSQLVESFISNGWDLQRIFLVIGISYGFIILLSAFVIKIPKSENYKNSTNNISSYSAFLRDKKFWLLFGIMFSGTFSGILVIGNLKPIGLSYGVSELYATIAISMLAIGNSLGRIIWGRITDLIGGRKAIPTALLVMGTTVFLILALSRNNLTFIIVSFFVGFGFSANFVLFATEVVNIYGIVNLNNIYPSIHISYGLAGIIGPIVAGKLFDATGSYGLPIIVAGLISVIGSFSYILFRYKNKS